jgi:hypothetical protein
VEHRPLKAMVQEVLKCTHDIEVPPIVVDGFRLTDGNCVLDS